LFLYLASEGHVVDAGACFGVLRAGPLAKKKASLIKKETFNYRAKTLRR
jgi:hypothetical protein